ncbi:MAG TPA: hypothetical protein VFN94_02830 [Nitrospiria bacterium]|nr:hypothetical protein [Nitrospiria bacterium]
MEPARLWIPGFEPVQFLILLAILFFVGIAVQRVLTAKGRRITMFWQVVSAWIACWAFLTFMLPLPLPFHLRANYLGVITLALFLYAGDTESGWQECCDTVLGMLRGHTRVHRFARVAVFVGLPLVTYAGLHDQMIPRFEAPLEFRAYHPPPPNAFTVQGATYSDNFSGTMWVRKTEEHPSPALGAAGVTLHIPPHLVELAGGYTHFQIAASGLDVVDVLYQAEAAIPALGSSLHKAPGGSTRGVNVFVLDKDGHFVGDDAYTVGGRSRCCRAKFTTIPPPGSHVDVIPTGSAFTPA